MSAPNIQNPKHITILVAFDKSKNIRYFGTCKITCNAITKTLEITTTSAENEEHSMISTFNRIFIQKGNALCVNDQTNKTDFMLLFVKNEYCITVFNAINKANVKSSNRVVRTNDTNDDIFKNIFFFPILKAIENQRTGFVELKNIFIDLFNSFEDVERRNYLKMVLPA